MSLDNIVTQSELFELSKKEGGFELFSFRSFFGVDGDLYFGPGKTIGSKDYKVVGHTTLVIPKIMGLDGHSRNDALRRAIERRRIKESNAYLSEYGLSVSSEFLLHHRGADETNIGSKYDVFSVLYLKVDEAILEEIKE